MRQTISSIESASFVFHVLHIPSRGLLYSSLTQAYFIRASPFSACAKLLSYKFENCCMKSKVALSSIKPPGRVEDSKLSRKYIFDVAVGHVWIRALKI